METRTPESKRRKLSSSYRDWTSKEVNEFLTGVTLTSLPFKPENGDDLDKLLVKIERKRKPNSLLKAQSLIKSLQYQQYKIYNDPIHGSIEVHPLLDKIINTPEFNRLKDIKQLGGAHYVYPGATHTRFEHSIGVCYIAGEFARCLQRKQPELEITDKDVLCVQIAGLCHDLGHGPFSHLFEKKVVKKIVTKEVVKKLKLPEEYKWEHEEISKLVFERIYGNLKEEFERYGLEDAESEFIKDMMEGCRSADDSKPKKRFFFYEIVANKITGIDVDKWDYFARDCHYLGISNDFDWRRCMLLSRVIEDPVTEHYRICFRDKEAMNIYGMFRTRSSLHQRAYQHKTTSVMEHMIAEVIYMAKDIALVRIGPGQEGVKTIQQVVEMACKGDVKGYLQLTDYIIQQIKCAEVGSNQPQLKEAQRLLERIEERDHFHCVKVQRQATPEEVKKFLEITEEDVHVMVIPFRFGSEKEPENPIDAVPFYHKDYPWKLTKLKVHQTVSKLMIPKEFKETEVRVYNKKSKKHSEKIAKAIDHPEYTPEKPASQDRCGNPEASRRLFQESRDS